LLKNYILKGNIKNFVLGLLIYWSQQAQQEEYQGYPQYKPKKLEIQDSEGCRNKPL